MSGIDQFSNRFREALMGGVLSAILPAFASAFAGLDTLGPATASTEFTIALSMGLLQSLPGILTIVGLLVALYKAGPPGLFGAILEVIGVSMVFNIEQDGGLGLLILGASIVVLFSLLPWPRIYREVLSDEGF